VLTYHVNTGKNLQFPCITLTHGTGIAQWNRVGLRARWSEVRVPVGVRNVSHHHRAPTGSGAHPTSFTIGTRGSFPAVKAAGVWSWPLTSV